MEGDLLAADRKIGDAASSYEQAIYFDDQCKEAYLKYARIYARMNPQLAIDMLNKLIALDPEYTIAYRDLASVYYENNQFKLVHLDGKNALPFAVVKNGAHRVRM